MQLCLHIVSPNATTSSFGIAGNQAPLGSQTKLPGEALDLDNELGASPPLCDDDEPGESHLLPSVVRGQLSVFSIR
jgi:hypothetical protein